MKNMIITKWIEPYKLLETIKDYYNYSDVNFDVISKAAEKKKFLKNLENTKNSIGLYMKNVNKYYLFTRSEFFDICNKLEETFKFSQDDYLITDDIELPFNMVDMGKAEAGIIIFE